MLVYAAPELLISKYLIMFMVIIKMQYSLLSVIPLIKSCSSKLPNIYLSIQRNSNWTYNTISKACRIIKPQILVPNIPNLKEEHRQHWFISQRDKENGKGND